ncbi:MAG TPA: hypothetical protein VGM34_02655 [Chlamydiales bacterium]
MAAASTRSFQERNEQIESCIRDMVKPPNASQKSGIVQICTDYLFSTEFASICSFIFYCQNHKSIELPANQALVVHDVSLIRSNIPEEEIPTDDNLLMNIRCFFGELISPLGKTFSVDFGEATEEPSCRRKLNQELCSLSYDADSTWTLSGKEPAELRLGSLLRLMMVSSIYKVTFEAPIIFWGLTLDEHQQLERAVHYAEGDVMEGGRKKRINEAFKQSTQQALFRLCRLAIKTFRRTYNIKSVTEGVADIAIEGVREISRSGYRKPGFGVVYPKGTEISIEPVPGATQIYEPSAKEDFSKSCEINWSNKGSIVTEEIALRFIANKQLNASK